MVLFSTMMSLLLQKIEPWVQPTLIVVVPAVALGTPGGGARGWGVGVSFLEGWTLIVCLQCHLFRIAILQYLEPIYTQFFYI